MSSPPEDPVPKWVRRAAMVVGASVALWFIGGFLFLRWIEADVAAEYAAGARVSTDGDSLGIPFFGFQLAWAVVLLMADAAAIIWLARRARRPHRAAAT